MPRLIVTRHDGSEVVVKEDAGRSVMEVIRDDGIDELLAMCGGCLSCATCHVHVDTAFADRLPPMTADEDDLLEGAETRDETSRLSCQILFTEELDGLRVTVARDE